MSRDYGARRRADVSVLVVVLAAVVLAAAAAWSIAAPRFEGLRDELETDVLGDSVVREEVPAP